MSQCRCLPTPELKSKNLESPIPSEGEGHRVVRLRAVADVVWRRMAGLVLSEGVLWALGGVLGCLFLGMLGDWLLNWPLGVRRLAWGVYAVVAVGLLRGFVWVPWRTIPRSEGVALLMERRAPEFRSRLISALQLETVPHEAEVARAFVDRLSRETEVEAGRLNLAKLVPADGLWRAVRRVGLLAAAASALFWAGGDTSRILVRRALGGTDALPTKTRILAVTGPKVLGRGDDLGISVLAGGILPKAGKLRVRHASGREQVLALDAVPAEAGRYQRVLANLTGSLTYQVQLNDARSDDFEVEVLPRPAVNRMTLTVEPPSYTGLKSQTLLPGELRILRGSRFRVEAEVSQPLSSASVRLEGLDREVGAVIEGDERTRFRGEIAVDELAWTGFAIRMVDARGIDSRDPAVYAVEVLEDQAPVVKDILPQRREELVTARGTVLVAMEAKDDFGLGGLRLAYQPASGGSGEPTFVDLEVGNVVTNVVRRRFDWKLTSLRPPVTEGTFLEFWVEAMDRREVGGPGIGRSDKYLVRVVSEAEKRSDLLTRAGDAIGRLGDVAQGQERLNESLGRIILEKGASR